MADIANDNPDVERAEGEDKGKKKQPLKNPNASKMSKDPNNKAAKLKTGKGAKPAKKGGGKLLIIIIIIVLTLLIAGIVSGMIIFDLFGARTTARDILINVVVWLDPEFTAIDDTLIRRSSEREEELDEREESLDEREAEILVTEEQLDTRESQLDRRASALDRREEQLNQQILTEESDVLFFRRHLTDDELEEITSISRTYTMMSPEDAAVILIELTDDEYVASILYFMDVRNRAPILTAMDPEYAALITEILLPIE